MNRRGRRGLLAARNGREGSRYTVKTEQSREFSLVSAGPHPRLLQLENWDLIVCELQLTGFS
jgi:hypothetical protein